MGRKNHNNISKTVLDPEKEKQIQEDKENDLFIKNEEKIYKLQQQEDKNLTTILDTRRAMLDYCDDVCVPLCDHLTIGVFQAFVEYLNE
jgi:hypothetical protein